jgi:hypothetical protein
MTIALRIIIGLWGLAFGLLAIRGLIDPQVYVEQFGLEAKGASINTLRADFSAFFLVSAACALWAATKPEKAALLYIPAALYGTALAGRLLGLALGDPIAPATTQAIAIEAISMVLMLFAARRLGKRAA